MKFPTAASIKSVLAIKLISEAHGRLLCNIKGLASNHQIYIGQVRQSLQAIEAYNSRPGLKAGLIRAYSYKTRQADLCVCECRSMSKSLAVDGPTAINLIYSNLPELFAGKGKLH